MTSRSAKVWDAILGEWVDIVGPPGPPGQFLYQPTAPTSPTNGTVWVDSDYMLEYTGGPMTWTPYTPVISTATSDWVLGNGTSVGAYYEWGSLVAFWGKIVWGTTSAFGSGTLVVSVPVNAYGPYYDAQININAQFWDDANSNRYDVETEWWGPDEIGFYLRGTGGLRGYMDASSPFVWHAGDIIRFAGTYQKAV